MPKSHKIIILILLVAAAGCAQGPPLPADEPQFSSTSAPAATLPPAWTATSTNAAMTEPPATATTTQEPTREIGLVEDTPPPVVLTPFEMGGSQDQPIVAFSSSREGNVEIFVMRLDGTGLRRLTENKAEDNYPRWSPDGFELAFTSMRETAEDTIGFSKAMLINADGSGERLLGIDKAALFPGWSPDGSLLAAAVTTNLGLYRTDGTLVRWLTQGIGILDRYPDWSPDGKLLAYTSIDNVAFESNIYTISPSGGGVRLLVDAGRFDDTPAWSPDGEWIAFSSNDSGGLDWDLNLVRSDGSGLTTLTQGFYPRWSPDGEWISFMRYENALKSDIYIVRPDGTDERRLTDWPGFDGYLDWRPMEEQGG
jgi:TolB protein